MNGFEIAEVVGNIIARIAPLISSGIHLGPEVDPVLERQLRGAMELANQALLDCDARYQKLLEEAQERLKK